MEGSDLFHGGSEAELGLGSGHALRLSQSFHSKRFDSQSTVLLFSNIYWVPSGVFQLCANPGDITGVKAPECSYQMREADKHKQIKNNYKLPELISEFSKVWEYKINT